MMRFYDLPTVVTLSRLSYLIVGENLIIFLLQNRSLFSSIEEITRIIETILILLFFVSPKPTTLDSE